MKKDVVKSFHLRAGNKMENKITKQFVFVMTLLMLNNHIYPSHSLDMEQFTRDMMDYFGAEDPVVLFDPLVVLTPLSLGITTSFISIEHDVDEPEMEAEVYKVTFSVKNMFSL